MPLSEPAERQPLHTRSIEMHGFRRADGLFDIEATLKDVKSYPFDSYWRGEVEAGDPVHQMHVRITVNEKLEVVAAEAVSEKTPYEICPQAAGGFEKLVGIRIGPGYMREVRQRYSGVHACTHIMELMRPIGTAAFQTVFPWLETERRRAGATEGEAMRAGGPPINSCFAFAADSPVVKTLFPERYVARGDETSAS